MLEKIPTTPPEATSSMTRIVQLCCLQVLGTFTAFGAAASVGFEFATKHSVHLDARFAAMGAGIILAIGANADLICETLDD